MQYEQMLQLLQQQQTVQLEMKRQEQMSRSMSVSHLVSPATVSVPVSPYVTFQQPNFSQPSFPARFFFSPTRFAVLSEYHTFSKTILIFHVSNKGMESKRMR
jgi:hypothetical protein